MTARRLLYPLAALLLIGSAGWLSAAPRVAEAEGPNEIRWVLTGIEANDGGTIRCALYRDASTWLDQSRRYRHSSARVRAPQAACVFRDIPAGTYAMAALHDADGDGEMDRSLIGLPREGFAISRNERNAMSRPDFDEAAVRYRGGQLVTRARMTYRR